MQPSQRWQELLAERLQEALSVLAGTPGVHGFLVGGSVGRGEPWPMSDIDLLPVCTGDHARAAAELERRHARLVDWWAASGRAQTLDMGALAFTTAEIRDAVRAGPEFAAARMGDRRWFHGLDKAFGGYGTDELGTAFTAWIARIRFDPAVVAARLDVWRGQARDALTRAQRAGDPAAATRLLQESARAGRMVLLESWGERLGSMGREWTRFERMAARHGHADIAARIAVLAGADVDSAAQRAERAPAWLRERIDLCLGARRAVGEQVSAAENARDQLAAFALHVARHRPDLDGDWTGCPDPLLAERLSEMAGLDAIY
ncbi:nucleotidyltransferase domain-containing protein [Actinoplanes sp. NBC_00393]|uniref:nucleotidyltransferase domain-containing protein n=1 Tax=Actinoplanes sp. NBC_00393 TaxID=2975953 RepID=UPI002E20A99C